MVTCPCIKPMTAPPMQQIAMRMPPAAEGGVSAMPRPCHVPQRDASVPEWHNRDSSNSCRADAFTIDPPAGAYMRRHGTSFVKDGGAVVQE